MREAPFFILYQCGKLYDIDKFLINMTKCWCFNSLHPAALSGSTRCQAIYIKVLQCWRV